MLYYVRSMHVLSNNGRTQRCPSGTATVSFSGKRRRKFGRAFHRNACTAILPSQDSNNHRNKHRPNVTWQLESAEKLRSQLAHAFHHSACNAKTLLPDSSTHRNKHHPNVSWLLESAGKLRLATKLAAATKAFKESASRTAFGLILPSAHSIRCISSSTPASSRLS